MLWFWKDFGLFYNWEELSLVNLVVYPLTNIRLFVAFDITFLIFFDFYFNVSVKEVSQ